MIPHESKYTVLIVWVLHLGGHSAVISTRSYSSLQMFKSKKTIIYEDTNQGRYLKNWGNHMNKKKSEELTW